MAFNFQVPSIVHNIILSLVSPIYFKTFLKSLLLPALYLLLIACSSGSNDTDTTTHKITGNAVKGVITGGIVSAYRIETDLHDASKTNRKLLGKTRTNSAGEYEINLSSENDFPLVILELTSDAETSMRCDVIDGCLYKTSDDAASVLFAEFGAELPLPTSFKLMGFKLKGQTKAYISPLSHIVLTTASALPGGLTRNNLNSASNWVAKTFELSADLLSIKTPDLTALSDLLNLSEQQLKQGILNSAFYTLTLSKAWSTGGIDIDALPLEAIFREAAYSAETLAEQLSTNNKSYSEALSQIKTDIYSQAQNIEGQPLVIIEHPNSLSVNENSNFSLHVLASGEGELFYQWKKDGTNIAGANASTYSVVSANLSDTGSYSVSITNHSNTLHSLNALVSVQEMIEPLTILQQPQNLNLTSGDPITLSVSVSGDGFYTYQWQKNGSILPNETHSTLHIAQSIQSDGGTYRVIVSNGISDLSSDFVSVIITPSIAPVIINQQPTNRTVAVGETVKFQVNASGGGYVRYQWRKNSVNIENAYSSELEINAADMSAEGYYDVVVSNSQGSVTSAGAQLTVLPSESPVFITLQPLSTSVMLADNINLRVIALGDGALNYQWLFNGQIIVGANQATYSIINASAENEGYYSVIIHNAYSQEESESAFVSVYAPNNPSVQLSWGIPSFREDGSPLEMYEINAYLLEYGDSPSGVTTQIKLTGASTTEYTITNIETSTLYARIATIDASGIQGKFSDWISIAID